MGLRGGMAIEKVTERVESTPISSCGVGQSHHFHGLALRGPAGERLCLLLAHSTSRSSLPTIPARRSRAKPQTSIMGPGT